MNYIINEYIMNIINNIMNIINNEYIYNYITIVNYNNYKKFLYYNYIYFNIILFLIK